MERFEKHFKRWKLLTMISVIWIGVYIVIDNKIFGTRGGDAAFLRGIIIGFLPLFCCLAIYLPFLARIDPAKSGKKIDKSSVLYNELSHQATVLQFNESNWYCLIVRKHETHTTAYTPEQVIFTSATVGGVTTGGFSKVGGYKTKHSTSLFNYDILYNGDEYKNSAEKPSVWSIQLRNREMLDAAQKDPFISTLLEGNTIKLKPMIESDCKKVVGFISGFGRS